MTDTENVVLQTDATSDSFPIKY